MKPWRKAMWCVGKITAESRERMYALCDLYGRPYNPQEPVACVDEKSKQLVKKVRLVLDNLNTHFRSSFEEVLGAEAEPVLQRIEFHCTPEHASWLDMAELEIGIMEKQCTGRRPGTELALKEEVAAWQNRLLA